MLPAFTLFTCQLPKVRITKRLNNQMDRPIVKKIQANKRPICTHCGRSGVRCTGDHVFPQCLWVGESTDRAIKVASCNGCNNPSDETILKNFFAVFDRRLAERALPHLRTRFGRKDFAKFLSTLEKRNETQLVAYAEEKITNQLRKMMMGVRRHLLGQSWHFVPPERFSMFQINESQGKLVIRNMPVAVGGSPEAFLMPSAFAEDYKQCPGNRFRDFTFGIKQDDEARLLIVMKFDRSAFGEANALNLICLASADPPGRCKIG
jgi:hypothetical protein